MSLIIRTATRADVPALTPLIGTAIAELQKGFLTGPQIDPARDPAKVRAMYTHPDFTRRGVGRLILARCEAAAAAEGFATLELMATLSGWPLYAAYGFAAVEEIVDDRGGAPVPLVRMRKPVVTS